MNSAQAIFFFFIIIIFVFSSGYVSGQSPSSDEERPYATADIVATFQPSLAVVTGVLSILFTLTFVLIIYAKCCHNDLRSNSGEGQNRHSIFNGSRRFSGLDKTAIESLPFFRFSALNGSKQGLECAVCLSKFEDVEILRLLPKCRHAFHIGCIDQWLEQHASCPLCRNKIAIDDPSVFLNQSTEDPHFELYIEREEEEEEDLKMGNKENLILERSVNDKNMKLMHRFNHRIVMSDAMFKNRWSNVSSSDLMFLNFEMVNLMSKDRFSSLDRFQKDLKDQENGILRIKEEMEMKRMFENKLSSMNRSKTNTLVLSENGEWNSKTRMVEIGRRSVSEITTVPRLSVLTKMNNAVAVASASASASAQSDTTEERRRRLWLPIAGKTAQWFANREEEINTTNEHLDV